MVGIVVTTSPSFNLYSIVVLPAASSPMLITQLLQYSNIVILTTYQNAYFLLTEESST